MGKPWYCDEFGGRDILQEQRFTKRIEKCISPLDLININ